MQADITSETKTSILQSQCNETTSAGVELGDLETILPSAAVGEPVAFGCKASPELTEKWLHPGPQLAF